MSDSRSESADTPRSTDEGADSAWAVSRRTGIGAGAATLFGAGGLWWLFGSERRDGGEGTDAETAAGANANANATAESAVASGTGGAVSSVHPDATAVGIAVLENGGNAVDAAVAVQFALSVVQPHTSGLGGGGFTLVSPAESDTVYAIDSRERAPLGVTPELFLDDEGEELPFAVLRTNGKAVGVPGTLRGCERLLNRFGTADLDRLLEPAIELAREGVVVDDFLGPFIDAAVGDGLFNSAAEAVFAPDGEPLEVGDRLRQPALAETLTLLREQGTDPFYTGEIAADIAATVQGLEGDREAGGRMTTEDIGSYNATVTVPAGGRYEGTAHDVTFRTMGSPSSGGITIAQILSLLEPLSLADEFDRRSGDTYHWIAEAIKLAFADREAYLGDSSFVDLPKQGLLDGAYLEQRRARLEETAASYEPGDPFAFQPGDGYRVSPRQSPESSRSQATTAQTQRHTGHRQPQTAGLIQPVLDADGGGTHTTARFGETTHFTTADSDGTVVSWTSTIEQLFGSGAMVPGRGFLLNNELTDFDSVPGGPNEVQPEKQPMSSMSPTIVFRDGDPILTLGSPGGPTIIATIVQIVLNIAEFGMETPAAIDEPRFFALPAGALGTHPVVLVGDGVPEAARTALADRGHDVRAFEELGGYPTIGNVTALEIDGERFRAVGDFRRGSAPAVVDPDSTGE